MYVRGIKMSEIKKVLEDRYEEFWYDIYNIEKEEVRNLKKYIDYVESTLRNYTSYSTDYDGIKDMFMMKHLDYLQEALECLLIGSYNGLSCIIRIMIENYIGFSLIKKYKKQNVWKSWYLHGFYKATKVVGNEPLRSKVRKNYIDLCTIFGVDESFANNIKPYGWLEKAVKLKNYNFKDACKNVDIDAYKDFNALSEFVHNNDVITKSRPILMAWLTNFIYKIYFYTDKMIRQYDHRYLRRVYYRKLEMDLLESLEKCINYKENINI